MKMFERKSNYIHSTGAMVEVKGFTQVLTEMYVSDGIPDSTKVKVGLLRGFTAKGHLTHDEKNIVLPLTELDVFDVDGLTLLDRGINRLRASLKEQGFAIVPFKPEPNKEISFLAVSTETVFGKRLNEGKPFHFMKGVAGKLTWKNWCRKVKKASEYLGREIDPNDSTLILCNQHAVKLKDMYGNWGSTCQYVNQPFTTLAMNQKIVVFEESNLTYSPSMFPRDVEGLDPEAEVSVPCGDGSVYLHPDHTLWEQLPPVELRGMGRERVNAVKVIGMRQFADADNPADDGTMMFHIGYHNDNRAFAGKTQVFGYQMASRAVNLEDRKMYLRACEGYLNRTADCIANGDAVGLIRSLTGDVKVIDDKPYRGQVLLLSAAGAPLTYVRNCQDTFMNMLVKRTGRRKVEVRNRHGKRVHGSTRTYAVCDETLDINQVALCAEDAKILGAKLGDSIIVDRSPFQVGALLSTYKVASVDAPATAIHPLRWAKHGGDFDGDTKAILPEAGVTACKRSGEGYRRFDETLKELFEDTSASDRRWNGILARAASISPVTELFEDLDGKGSFAAPVLRIMVAKALTGYMDNLVTRMRLGGMSDTDLRSAWNVFPQMAVSGHKHGATLVDPTSLEDVLKESKIPLGVIDAFSNLLAGRKDLLDGKIAEGKLETGTETGQRMLGTYANISFDNLMKAESRYEELFSAAARKHFDEVIRGLSEDELEIARLIWVIDAKTRKVKRFDGSFPQAYMHYGSQFYHNLNAIDCLRRMAVPGAKTAARNDMIAAIRKAATKDEVLNEHLLLVGLRLLYLAALGEPKTKSWLLWNHISEEHSKMVVRDVLTVASMVSDKCPGRKVDESLIDEVLDSWKMSSDELE